MTRQTSLPPSRAARPDDATPQRDDTTGPRNRLRRTAFAALPWALVAATLVAALLVTGTPVGAIARYAAYWLLAVLLPGTLVYRALRGSTGNLPEDLGYGAVTGLLCELVAWAIGTATGFQHLLWVWPVAVAAAFLAVPPMRRHWRIAEPRPLPLRWSWGVAAACVGAIVWAAGEWAHTPLPPTTADYYPDLLYHLGLVHELTRTMPFQVPQVAGEVLRYHYLSDAHLASASLVTGVDPAVVLFRLWLGPVLVVSAVVIAALARQVTGRWWAGPVTAGVALLARPLLPGGPAAVPGGLPVSLLSPSQTYLVPFLVVLTALGVDLVRGRPLGRAWWLVGPLALACAGAKSSGLPLLVAGLALATVARAATARSRRTVAGEGIDARPAWWPPLLALGVLLAAMGLGSTVFVGGGAGGLTVQVGSQLQWIEPYVAMFRPLGPTAPGPLPPGLAHPHPAGVLFALGIVAWWILLQAPRIVGLAVPLGRSRRDPAVWLLAGATVAGTGAMWLLFHPSDSQAYFFLPTLPYAAVLTVLLLTPRPGATRSAPRVLLAASAVGLLAAGLLRIASGHAPEPAHTYRAWAAGMARPVLAAAVVAVVLAAAWLLVRRRPGLRGHGTAVAVSAVLGASLAAGAIGTLPRAAAVVTGVPAPTAAAGPVWAAEIRAAQWLDGHARPDDVVATNVHCLHLRTRPWCDSRAFWVSGFGGHRTLVESWAYTDAAIAAHGRHGHAYPAQPFGDRSLYEENERAFAAPDAATLATLRRRYAVRWLFADTRAAPVSPRLPRFAHRRHTDGPVTIYELP
ncbi:hypothetical protein GCM10022220_12160 [Actinocatenispora rupis]|uniref:Uncharacterized protein n=1 Tax=Actinocatenispora rupis TaxID=519421 RepID=A0A8J3J461_9ACTN|nr:hypothetical protein Aru02nite_06780 [Actinocatenispora rupis]